jgi:DNA-binding MarR family transcriptional regulator
MNTKDTTKKNLAEGFINSLYYQIKLTEKCSKMLAKQLEDNLELEITLDELTALATISMHNGEIHQRDLAKILLKDRANTGRMLNNLDKNGYIKRVEKTKNKRQANMINLTEKGTKTLDKLTDIIRPMFDNVHNKMTFDIDYLKKGLIELRELMKQEIDIHI